MRTSWMLAVFLGLVAPACAPSPIAASRDGLVARAAFEMWCPTTWLTVHELDGGTMLVQGCGARAVYVGDCAGEGCRWRSDTALIVRPPLHHRPRHRSRTEGYRMRDPMETRE